MKLEIVKREKVWSVATHNYIDQDSIAMKDGGRLVLETQYGNITTLMLRIVGAIQYNNLYNEKPFYNIIHLAHNTAWRNTEFVIESNHDVISLFIEDQYEVQLSLKQFWELICHQIT